MIHLLAKKFGYTGEVPILDIKLTMKLAILDEKLAIMAQKLTIFLGYQDGYFVVAYLCYEVGYFD